MGLLVAGSVSVNLMKEGNGSKEIAKVSTPGEEESIAL